MSRTSALVAAIVSALLVASVKAADAVADPLGAATTPAQTTAAGAAATTNKPSTSSTSSDSQFGLMMLSAAIGGLLIGAAVGMYCGKRRALRRLEPDEKSAYPVDAYGAPASGYAGDPQAYPARSPMPMSRPAVEEYHEHRYVR